MCSVFNVSPYVYTVFEAQQMSHHAKIVKLVVLGMELPVKTLFRGLIGSFL